MQKKDLPWASAIRRLAEFISPSEWGSVQMAMLAYFDESETIGAEQHSYVVAGYVADAHRWVRFEREWQRVLNEFNAPYLHMKEMANKANKKSIYHNWLEQKCADFLGRLAWCITSKQDSIKSVGCAIPASDYIALATDNERKQIGYPYHLCLYWCFPGVLKTTKKDGGIIDFVFDEKSDMESHARKVLRIIKNSPTIKGRERLAGLSYEDDKLFLPLQAADFLAYEMNKHFREPTRRRKSLLAINSVSGIHKFATREWLAGIMEEARKRQKLGNP